MANCSSDVSIMHDEFFELLWDNGPVVIQGPLKSSYHADCNHVCRVQDKDRKVATYPAVESKVNILPLPAPTSGFQMSAQTDDVNPWNYPMEDSICNVNCSEYLCDYAGVDLNSTTESQMNDVKRRWPNQTIRDSNDTEQGNVSEPSRTSKSQPFLSYVANTKSRIADTGMGSTNIHDGGVGLKNFMHVSSPFALGKSQLENADKLEINEKATTATTRNLMESLLNESSINLKSSLGRQGQLALIPSKSERRSSPKSPREVIIVEPPEAFCQKDTSVMNNQCTTGNCTRSPKQIQSPSFAASVALACHETDKVQEAVVASSVYLESSSEPASNNHRQREKRKWREREESEYQSEDVEEEPVRLKKPATLQRRSTRRNRAAEVHNLSERRRRDRINEKMRVLQELIPNCNKTDKASMLDEAIEYLKTLQMQVQIMSNGGGVCMHPMMMQHIRVPTMAHFSPMGLGMGMGVGLGYGMGMYNMNGSARCPCVPIYRPRFPCSSIPGTMMLKPGQGFPMSMAHGPPVNFVPGTIPSPPIPSVSSKEQKQQTLNLEKIEKPNAGDYKMQSSIQATKECFEDIITKQT